MGEKSPDMAEVLERLDRIVLTGPTEQNGPASSMLQKNLSFWGMGNLRLLGVSHARLLELAEDIGVPNQKLATELWNNDLYEAKLLSCILSDPEALTENQADKWVNSFDAWIVCDYCCNKALWKAPFAVCKAYEWSNADSAEAVYAGFCLTAALAANIPGSIPNELGFFDNFLFLARKHASNEDVNVRRMLSSALKMIGLRNADCHEAVLEACHEIAAQPSEYARWTASQALAELMNSDNLKSLGQRD